MLLLRRCYFVGAARASLPAVISSTGAAERPSPSHIGPGRAAPRSFLKSKTTSVCLSVCLSVCINNIETTKHPANYLLVVNII